MNSLPILLDAEEALEFFQLQTNPSDPVRAYVVGVLAHEGFKNRDIREALGIRQVYTVTHLLRVSKALSNNEMDLWYKNPDRISLGHLRAVAKFPRDRRERLIRKLLISRTPVHQFEALARNEGETRDIDIESLERSISEVTGRPTTIRFNKTKQIGSLTLSFYCLDDLDVLLEKLGYRSQDEF